MENEKDRSRTKLEVKFYCFKHPDTELNFSTKSKVEANSAFEINAKILVHPCIDCENEINEVRNAIHILTKFNSLCQE